MYLLISITTSANNLPKYFHNVFDELWNTFRLFLRPLRAKIDEGHSRAPPPPQRAGGEDAVLEILVRARGKEETISPQNIPFLSLALLYRVIDLFMPWGEIGP